MKPLDKNSPEWIANEARRLQQLHEFQILDTEDDTHFDQITRIAAVLCETPMALITFIDRERQWFKSKVGVDATETPREIAFCAHGIEQDEAFVIPDASQDPRFRDNPLVTGPLQIKFYAGVPLITSERNRLGMICVVDRKPRDLNPQQIEMLQLLAKQVMDQLELKNVARVLLARNKQLRDAQAALREKSEFVNSVLDHLPVAVFCKDAKQNFAHTVWNKTAAENFGWPQNEVLGKSIAEIPLAASRSEKMQSFDAETLRRQTPSPISEFTYEVKNKGPRTFKLQTIPMKNADGEHQYVLGIFQDITLERETQALLTHSSKMSSLGEMAAGIAHEINNPLAVIRSKAQSMKELASAGKISPETLVTSLEKIDATTVRIAKIIAGLRKFARQGNNEPFTKNSVTEIVDNVVDLCSWSYKHLDISLDVHGLKEDIEIECRSVELVQVLVNLLNNARDACAPCENKWVSFEVVTFEQLVQFKVSDSGPGIPKDIQAKIMQPFFTTKPPGKGTGLGLSISKGIIDSHEGRLWLDTSSPNTCFVIQLPRAQVALVKPAA